MLAFPPKAALAFLLSSRAVPLIQSTLFFRSRNSTPLEFWVLTARERFYWLTAQRSTIVQSSPVHTGFCADPGRMLAHLFERTVR